MLRFKILEISVFDLLEVRIFGIIIEESLHGVHFIVFLLLLCGCCLLCSSLLCWFRDRLILITKVSTKSLLNHIKGIFCFNFGRFIFFFASRCFDFFDCFAFFGRLFFRFCRCCFFFTLILIIILNFALFILHFYHYFKIAFISTFRF